MIIHISFANVFIYKGVTIGWHDYIGPTIFRRGTDIERNYKGVSLRTWSLVNKFSKLSKEDREQFRIV